MYLVHNPTEEDINNSVEGLTSIKSLDNTYRLLTPVGEYEFSNGVLMNKKESKIFSLGRKCVNWLQLSESDIDSVLEYERKYAQNIIKEFQRISYTKTVLEQYNLMNELSELKAALDDGFMGVAKHILDTKQINQIYTQDIKNWFSDKMTEYFSKFPQ